MGISAKFLTDVIATDISNLHLRLKNKKYMDSLNRSLSNTRSPSRLKEAAVEAEIVEEISLDGDDQNEGTAKQTPFNEPKSREFFEFVVANDVQECL